MTATPVLYVVACGGRPAGDLSTYVPRLTQSWDVGVIATPSALKFVDLATLSERKYSEVLCLWACGFAV
jgi:hypothetical protein